MTRGHLATALDPRGLVRRDLKFHLASAKPLTHLSMAQRDSSRIKIMSDIEDLLWRRQFLISSKPWESPANWQHSSVGPFQVYCHPELQLTRAISANPEIEGVLVGFALDPDFPGRSNHQILEQLITVGRSLESVVESLNGLTG